MCCNKKKLKELNFSNAAFFYFVLMFYCRPFEIHLGPHAATVLKNLTNEDLSTFGFMTGRAMEINGISCHVSRCGYTGEDGFEVRLNAKFFLPLLLPPFFCIDLESILTEIFYLK